MMFLAKPKTHYADVVLLPISYGAEPVVLRGIECIYSTFELIADNGVVTHWFIVYGGDRVPVIPVSRTVFIGTIVE